MFPICPSIQSAVSITLQSNKTHANGSIINVVILRGAFNWSETLVSKTLHAMNSNKARRGIKGLRHIEREAEDRILSSTRRLVHFLIVSQVSILD